MFISKKINIFSIKKLPLIKSILNDEMNNECFDCGSVNPEFISINNAIFLCRNCSFIHKKFPIEISKIIPNNLYNLNEKELYYLCIGGNRRLSEFIYLNPELGKYSSDILYKRTEMKYYRYNLAIFVNEKLRINKNIGNNLYIKNNNYNIVNNSNLNNNIKHSKSKILNTKENEDIINYSEFEHLSTTTNKISNKYKKVYIPEYDNEYHNIERNSVNNRKPEIFLDMDYNNNHNIINHSSKNKSTLDWINNSIDPLEYRIKSYGNLGKTNFNYKNYINNTININNSNNNNFYFNQSESDIDKNYNIRNSANNSHISFYNKFKFEIPKKFQRLTLKDKFLNISTYKTYSKPILPKYGINLKKTKQSMNNSNFKNSNKSSNKMNNNLLLKNKIKLHNNNIEEKDNKNNQKILKTKNINTKLKDKYPFSDKIPSIKYKNKTSRNNNIITDNYNNIILKDSENIQNLSSIEIENKDENEGKKEPKKYNKIYKERKVLEGKERKKMEFEEKRRIEEIKKRKEEEKEKNKLNKKRMTRKERLKLIEEERQKMQIEEINTKKKKAFENKVIKEEDEEYEQDIESPKRKNSEKDLKEYKNIKEEKEEIKEEKGENQNIKNDIVDTFKNSIRNKYKRKKNKK